MTTKPEYSAFARVQQQDRHDDVFAVIAMLGGASLADVFKQAEVFGMPQAGPFYPWAMDASFVAQLLMSRNLVGGQWKECDSFNACPDVAIVMCDYSADKECGRVVLFHRLPAGHPSKVAQYVIDPYPHADPKLHFRQDLAGLTASWFIEVKPVQPSKAKGK